MVMRLYNIFFFIFISVGYLSSQTCGVGFYLISSVCTICPQGSYCPGDDNAYQCPLGKVSPLTGSINCVDCPAGKYQDQTGQIACLSCPEGRYSDFSGAVSCIKCSPGTYQSETGQTSCLSCLEGTYSSISGSVNCQSCSQGTYQDETGSTSCKSCPAGRFSAVFGSVICSECSQGTYSNVEGSVSCQACSQGTYQDGIGQMSCKNCDPGSYQDAEGQINCKLCDLGKFNSTYGSSFCFDCPIGQFSNTTGSEFCSNCPVNTTTIGVGSTSELDCSVALPLVLRSFRAYSYFNSIKIEWVTETEKNASFHILQKSQNLEEWQNIYKVNAGGNHNTGASYSFIDPFSNQLTYYRIKTTDFDGTVSYSNIIYINQNAISELKVYPNPFNNLLNIAHPNEKILNLYIYDMQGREILRSENNLSNIVSINLNGLDLNLFIIKIRTENGNHVERVQKINF
jgi:hypothetical protein